jgi:hypothetical protein
VSAGDQHRSAGASARAAVFGIRIAGRYPPEQAPDLIVGRPDGVKSVIACDVDRQRKARDADAGPPFSAIMAAS